VKLFDGKSQAQKVEDEIKNLLVNISDLDKSSIAFIQIGEDLSSEKFVQIKAGLCEKLGIKNYVFKIDEKSKSDIEIFDEVRKIFDRKDITGGIIQLPVPGESLHKVLDFIPLEKDVDVISTEGKKAFYNGDFSVLPPVVGSLNNFIQENNINLKDLNVVVVGDGELVGKPVSFFLSKNGSNVSTICDYNGESKINCDLLVLCAGVSNLVKGENISNNSDVVDFGSSVVDNKCVGDLDLNSKLEHLNCVSKSPGGMGPLVVRYLLLNWVKATLEKNK